MENIDSLGNQPPILGRFVDMLGLYVSHDMLWKTLLHLLHRRGRRPPFAPDGITGVRPGGLRPHRSCREARLHAGARRQGAGLAKHIRRMRTGFPGRTSGQASPVPPIQLGAALLGQPLFR